MPRVTVDEENNTEKWWDALREREPKLAERLDRSLTITVTSEELERLKALPGWQDSDAPEYAPTPLVVSDERMTLARPIRRKL